MAKARGGDPLGLLLIRRPATDRPTGNPAPCGGRDLLRRQSFRGIETATCGRGRGLLSGASRRRHPGHPHRHPNPGHHRPSRRPSRGHPRPSNSRRHVVFELPAAERAEGFTETVIGLSPAEALDEAGRCLRCDIRDRH